MSFPNNSSLSPTISLQSPISTTPAAAGTPTLIILCTWMSASPRPISKYVSGISSLYPNTKILVIQSGVRDILGRSSAGLRKNLEPALDVVLAEEKNSSSRIVAAGYSNGGCQILTHLASSYQSRQGRPLPIKSLILDSCPGYGISGGLKSPHTAIYLSLPPSLRSNPFLSIPLSFLIWITLYILLTLNTIFPSLSLDPLPPLRSNLNNPTHLPLSSTRTYIFSHTDELVDHRAVLQHAEEAEDGVGYKVVRREEFVGTRHVGHLVGDGERYWGVVRREFEGGNEGNDE